MTDSMLWRLQITVAAAIKCPTQHYVDNGDGSANGNLRNYSAFVRAVRSAR